MQNCGAHPAFCIFCRYKNTDTAGSHKNLCTTSYYRKTDENISRYVRDARSLIPIMQDIQAEYRYLPAELLSYVAKQIGIAETKAYSVATFYENFSFEAKGKYVIKVCDGTPGSPGCKTFSLTGAIENIGLIEVPMGSTLRQIIFDIGGGLKNGAKFKAVQIGGPSGGCLTEEHLDVPLDFDSVKKYNAIIGSGGMVVMSQDTCMVEVARFFMSFTQRKSCGKCTPCRCCPPSAPFGTSMWSTLWTSAAGPRPAPPATSTASASCRSWPTSWA